MEIEEGAIDGSNVELDPGGTCALAIQHVSFPFVSEAILGLTTLVP